MIALALPLTPVLVACAVLLLRGRPGVLGPVAVAGLLAALGLAAWAAAAEPAATWRWSPAIELGVAVEGFARVMVVLVPLIAVPIVVFAAATEEEGRLRLLALMTAFVGAMLLLVVAADFLTLLIAWELVGAISWALIGHGWREPENARSAAQAFVTTRVGDLGLYLAAGLTFAAAGTFAYAGLEAVGRPALDVIAAGVLLAAAAKSAQLPFSAWLFAAMAGPTPVSALLHSATLVAAGAYLLIRLAPAFEATGWFLPAVAGIGLATAFGGGIVALVQRHAKRALAGSTSAQYGLMFLAVGAGSVAAGGAHLVAHAAFKSLLFLAAGLAVHASGTHQLGGMLLGRTLPMVAALSLVGALALAAVPPLGAAWTKEQIVAAAVHRSPWVAAGIFGAGFLSVLYAARYQLLAFGRPSATAAAGRQTPLSLGGPIAATAAIAVLAALTVALSAVWLPGAAGLVETAVGAELTAAAPWELPVALAVIAAAGGVAWRLSRRGRLVDLGLSARAQTAIEDWLGLPAATDLLVVRPVLALSGALARFDERVVDAGVRGTAGTAALVSRSLGRFDDRVVDAGVRGVAAFAALLSRFSLRRGEWTFDGAVHATADWTMRLASGSRRADDHAVDGAVEGSAYGIGRAGQASRRLQTGQTHHYYVILAVGLATAALVLLIAGGSA